MDAAIPPTTTLSLPRPSRALRSAMLVLAISATTARAQLPPPPTPPENPSTAEKVLLGKALFFEEQLSSSNTVACATCHRVQRGGADPRTTPHPGPDGEPGNFDDVWGSPGLLRIDDEGHYRPDPVLGMVEQLTRRSTPSHIGAAYHRELGHDGRIGTSFRDPTTDAVVIADGGALEAQSLEPILSTVEMAEPGRSWDDVVRKLELARPLRLATDLPADLANLLVGQPSYPQFFALAFGDDAITPVRIAFALASYQRSLIADQTPYDRHQAGDDSALSADELQGLALFEGKARCAICHPSPLLTDDLYHNTGVRPAKDDRGRELVSGDRADAGKFKTPGLRNVGLRRRTTHLGRFPYLSDHVEFYDRGGYFHRHQDPEVIPLGLSDEEKDALRQFLVNGLTDPRVAAAQPPFDQATLRSQRLWQNVRHFGDAQAGDGDHVPETLLVTPPHLGHDRFRVGLRHGRGGAPAVLAFAGERAPPELSFHGVPVHVALDPAPRLFFFRLSGEGPGAGHATHPFPIPDDPALLGRTIVLQWFIADPGGRAGLAATAGTELEFF